MVKCWLVKRRVITQSGVAFGLPVLAPLTRYLHFIRQPGGPAQTEHPCSGCAFRQHPCWLSWLPHYVQRCEMPAQKRPQPALKLQCVLLNKGMTSLVLVPDSMLTTLTAQDAPHDNHHQQHHDPTDHTRQHHRLQTRQQRWMTALSHPRHITRRHGNLGIAVMR